MSKLIKNIINTLLPSTCYMCDSFSERAVCKSCIEKFNTIYRNEKRLLLKNPPLLIQAPFVYKGVVKEMIEDIKYHGVFFAVPFFAEHLADMIKEYEYDFLVPVPLHFLRKWKRGFNQSEEIAKEISKILRIPVYRGVVRVKNTKTQTSLSRKERIENIKGAFKVKDERVKGKRLAIIDDVLTTGATTIELARTLYQKEAKKVDIYTASMAEFGQ